MHAVNVKSIRREAVVAERTGGPVQPLLSVVACAVATVATRTPTGDTLVAFMFEVAVAERAPTEGVELPTDLTTIRVATTHNPRGATI